MKSRNKNVTAEYFRFLAFQIVEILTKIGLRVEPVVEDSQCLNENS